MSNENLTLEKLKIAERITSLEGAVSSLVKEMRGHDEKDEKMFAVIQDNINKLNMLIIGDGGKAGIAEKVRGIEGMANHIKGVWGVCAAGFMEFLYRTFFHHGGPKG